MAARLNKRHDDEARNKIQSSQLINRLNDNAMGKLKKEMTSGQVKSAEILLRKRLPDLATVTLQGDEDGGPVKVTRVEIVAPSGDSKN